MAAEFDDILAANRAYAADFRFGELTAPAARGLAVLTCIDSRIEPLVMLGLKPGDAKIVRNAGARVTDDSVRSLVLAANLLGVNRIMVVAHTDCAMVGTNDEALREQLALTYPAAAVADFVGRTMHDQYASLAADVQRLGDCPLLPGGIAIAGFEYDVQTGLLSQIVATTVVD
ncbi:MAG: carbonic anhydrase [Thermoleophilia bacterium]|nr:carbonic anhydrase [Thermoleophilia bacterium]